MTTATRRGARWAFRRWRMTSERCTPRSAQTSSATASATPMSADTARRPPPDARSGFGKRQRDEVEQLLQQRTNGFEAAVPGQLVGELLAHGVGALEGRPAAVAEDADLDGHR